MALESIRYYIPRVDVTASLIPSPEQKYQEDKVLKDLREGFQVKFANANPFDGYVAVVTRFNDDLFVVETSHSSLISPNPTEGFFRFGLKISRRKKLQIPEEPSGYEIWQMHATSRHPVEERFQMEQSVNCLNEQEFWRRYNLSIVDKKATRDFSYIQKNKLAGN